MTTLMALCLALAADPGITVRLYQLETPPDRIPRLFDAQTPNADTLAPALDRALGSHGLTLGTLSAHADGGGGQSSTAHDRRRDDAPTPEARPAPPSPSPTTTRGARVVI